MDPLMFIRKFQQSYLNFRNLWKTTGKVPLGVILRDPGLQPITENEIPEAARALLNDYREEHKEREFVLIKYLRTVNGDPVLVVEDESGLPEDHQILTLSQTITLNTSQITRVVTDLFVARMK